MVGRWYSDVAEILSGIVCLGIILAKLLERTLALLVEIAVLIALLPFAPWSLAVEEQRGIALKTEMDVEIDVEAGRNGLLRNLRQILHLFCIALAIFLVEGGQLLCVFLVYFIEEEQNRRLESI